MWVTAVFSALRFRPECLHSFGQLLEQRLCLRFGPVDQEDHIVRVPDEPVGRATGPLQALTAAVVAAHLLPVRLVLAV
jgi:hypothetical protein